MRGQGHVLATREYCAMIRVLPKPGLLTGLVVAASVVGGVAFGAAAVSAALALRLAVRGMARR